jgi:hypothetical protein
MRTGLRLLTIQPAILPSSGTTSPRGWIRPYSWRNLKIQLTRSIVVQQDRSRFGAADLCRSMDDASEQDIQVEGGGEVARNIDQAAVTIQSFGFDFSHSALSLLIAGRMSPHLPENHICADVQVGRCIIDDDQVRAAIQAPAWADPPQAKPPARNRHQHQVAA